LNVDKAGILWLLGASVIGIVALAVFTDFI
jgi:hypothetical protein